MSRPTAPTMEADSELVARARSGDLHAFSQLWERHRPAALRFAYGFVPGSDAEDLTSEAFASILQTLRNGGGPTDLFRPYLYVTIRNIAIRWASRRECLPPVNYEVDFDLVVDPARPDDPAVDAADRSIIANTFRQLPRRWQEVLWYTEVEGMKAREVAPILGMSSNAVSALSHRARAAFRKSWIEAHAADAISAAECKDAARELERSSEVSPRLALHLDHCAACRQLHDRSADLAGRLRVVLVPLLLGGGAGGILLEQLARQAAEQSLVATITSLPTVAGPGSTSVVAAAQMPHLVSAALAVATAASIVAAAVVGLGPQEPVSASAPSKPETVRAPSEDEQDRASHGDSPPTPTPTAPEQKGGEQRGTEQKGAGQPRPGPGEPQPPAPPSAPSPPSVQSSFNPSSTAPMAMSGTAVPGSTVTVTDGVTQLGSVVADGGGSWVSPVLAIQPHTKRVFITQTTPQGMTSAPTVIEPGFRPTLPWAPSTVSSGTVVDLIASGWPGANYRVIIDGVPGPVRTIPAGGQFSVYTGFVMMGVHEITFGYVDPATQEITVPQTFHMEGTP